jgi:hypothetical protein
MFGSRPMPNSLSLKEICPHPATAIDSQRFLSEVCDWIGSPLSGLPRALPARGFLIGEWVDHEDFRFWICFWIWPRLRYMEIDDAGTFLKLSEHGSGGLQT